MASFELHIDIRPGRVGPYAQLYQAVVHARKNENRADNQYPDHYQGRHVSSEVFWCCLVWVHAEGITPNCARANYRNVISGIRYSDYGNRYGWETLDTGFSILIRCVRLGRSYVHCFKPITRGPRCGSAHADKDSGSYVCTVP